MAPRNTTTGHVLEEMILPSLTRGGYTYESQVHVGQRLGGRRHMVDVVARDHEGNGILISLKWQQSSGTAEQKVAFEAICLADAVLSDTNEYEKAYLVLGGNGWTLRDFYIGGGLNAHLKHGDRVTIASLESFVGWANAGQL